jgi:rubrerythrin
MSNSIPISRKLKFYKEADERWYVELPEWEGSKADLEMVAGADTMLNYMAEGNNYVNLHLSEEAFDGADKLEFIRIATEIGNGAHYIMRSYAGIEFNLEMWICDVCMFVFNKFPMNIYLSKYDTILI